ncbi:8678_t:CDS:10 [Diversispora eburnea]|uniref:8678_t:CDS:1 n=1 Tax=Diversispora eburnea TaxID=1213867 RepID=A0A9N9BJY7_9GLOM|nr:8678_t:CDS:10 [Diversispora eburnea]
MADYQFVPNPNDTIPKYRKSLENFDVDSIMEFDSIMNDDKVEDNLPPPSFSRIECPMDYGYRQNMAVVKVLVQKGDGQPPALKLINRSRRKKFLSISIDIPPPEVVKHQNLASPESIARIQKLFSERPIWTRLALLNNLPVSERRIVKMLLPLISYWMINGPWRDCWIRYGYDPRKDKDARFSVPRTSHIFDGRTTQRDIAVFQMCDITDPLLKSLIESPDSVQEDCTERDGHYKQSALLKMRKVMRRKFKALTEDKTLKDEDFEDLLCDDSLGNEDDGREVEELSEIDDEAEGNSHANRDSSTGIQPFLPPVPSRKETSKIEIVLGFILKPILGILKFLLVGADALILFLLVDVIGLILIKFKLIYRGFHFIITFILVRLALFFMGFYWIQAETISLRRGRGNSFKTREKPIKSGDIIVCNYTSYVDLLYLAFRFDPVFTQIYSQTNKLRPISLWTALKLTGSYPELVSPIGTKTFSLHELMIEAKNNSWGPIVIFPEGTTSNGRALLKFIPIFKDYSFPIKNFSINIITFRYEYENFSPTFTVGSKLWHLMRLCSQFGNSLHVRIIAPQDSPSSSSYTVQNVQTSAASKPEDTVGFQIQHVMGMLCRLRKTNLGVSDKITFLDYYLERKSGVYTKR